MIYDDAFYSYRYPNELMQMTAAERRAHWCSFGINEGRCASPVFDSKYYSNRYSDLRSTYGTNYTLYAYHYFWYGMQEGRRGSLAFDAPYYVEHNTDLSNPSGNSYVALTKHFVDHGMSEFRNGLSDAFGLKNYRDNYKDLYDMYGSNAKCYIAHFLSAGYQEGRIANRRLHLIYHSNGGSFSDGITRQFDMTAGAATTLITVRPSRDGYTFVGWSKNSSSGTAEYSAGQTVTLNNETTLYAVWEMIDYDKLILPSDTETIEDEAFSNTSANYVLVPDSVTFIGSGAFAGNSRLYKVVILSDTATFGSNVFSNCPNVVVIGRSGSNAESYCQSNNIAFRILTDSDILDE